MNDDTPSDLAARTGRLADQLQDAGHLTDPRWRQALHEVPRHLFVPDVALADPNDQEPNEYPVDRAADPEKARWQKALAGAKGCHDAASCWAAQAPTPGGR